MQGNFKAFFVAAIIYIYMVLLSSQSVMAGSGAIGAGEYGVHGGWHEGKDTENKARHAVVDKISGGFATFLVGEDELEMVVNIASLKSGTREGDWFLLYENGDFVANPKLAEKRRKDVKDRLDMLRGK